MRRSGRGRVVVGASLWLACGLTSAACLPPEDRPTTPVLVAVAPPDVEPGRSMPVDERWSLSDPAARRELEGTPFGEQEIREFWQRKGWRTTKREERYFAEVQALLKTGAITPISRWGVCPYTPVYQAVQPIRVLGTPVQRMQEFHFEMCENENELQLGNPRFKRIAGYQEDHEDGHATDTAQPKRSN